jgi:hypothetical protein
LNFTSSSSFDLFLNIFENFFFLIFILFFIKGARHVALKSGASIETPAYNVNRLCGSGIQALVDASFLIRRGFYFSKNSFFVLR